MDKYLFAFQNKAKNVFRLCSSFSHSTKDASEGVEETADQRVQGCGGLAEDLVDGAQETRISAGYYAEHCGEEFVQDRAEVVEHRLEGAANIRQNSALKLCIKSGSLALLALTLPVPISATSMA